MTNLGVSVKCSTTPCFPSVKQKLNCSGSGNPYRFLYTLTAFDISHGLLPVTLISGILLTAHTLIILSVSQKVLRCPWTCLTQQAGTHSGHAQYAGPLSAAISAHSCSVLSPQNDERTPKTLIFPGNKCKRPPVLVRANAAPLQQPGQRVLPFPAPSVASLVAHGLDELEGPALELGVGGAAQRVKGHLARGGRGGRRQ